MGMGLPNAATAQQQFSPRQRMGPRMTPPRATPPTNFPTNMPSASQARANQNFTAQAQTIARPVNLTGGGQARMEAPKTSMPASRVPMPQTQPAPQPTQGQSFGKAMPVAQPMPQPAVQPMPQPTPQPVAGPVAPTQAPQPVPTIPPNNPFNQLPVDQQENPLNTENMSRPVMKPGFPILGFGQGYDPTTGEYFT